MARALSTLVKGRSELGRRAAERARTATGRLVRTAEIGAGAFGISAVSGWRGGSKGLTFWNMPLELVAGISLYALGGLGVAGEYSDDLINFGDGSIAAYLGVEGRKLGIRRGGASAGEEDWEEVLGMLEPD